ncbi:MAG: VTT domain-containing protein [Chloroflexi bacterium]|nr:VTT domain-containing protein [Chloroflexota bacterium]
MQEKLVAARPEPETRSGKALGFWGRWGRVIALVLMLALSLLILGYQEQLQRFRTYGYLGLFVLTFLSNATVIFPAPSMVLPLTMATVLNPWAVAVVSAAGATLGELSGYLAGFTGKAFVEDYRLYRRVQSWMARHGEVTLFILAALPVPIFDLAGIIAGATRVPVLRFLLWTFLGKLVKMLSITVLGHWVGRKWLEWLL